MFLSKPLTNQPSHSVNIYSNYGPLLFPHKVDGQVYSSKLCPLEALPLLSRPFWMGLQFSHCPFLAFTHISRQSIYETSLGLFSLYPLVVRSPFKWGEGDTSTIVWMTDMGIWVTCSGSLVVPICGQSWLLGLSDFINLHAWQDLACNGHFWMCSYLVPHGQAFCLYWGPVLHQDLFLKRCVILWCRWHGLALEPQGPPTQASLKLCTSSFPTMDTSVSQELLYHMAWVTGLLASRPRPAAEHFESTQHARGYLCSAPDKWWFLIAW